MDSTCAYSSIQVQVTNEHDKIYNKTCATSEVSDKPAHPPGLTRVFAYFMCLSQPPDYTKRDEREPLPYRVDIQADMSLCWLHRSFCRFCHGLAQIKVDLLTYMLPLFNKTT